MNSSFVSLAIAPSGPWIRDRSRSMKGPGSSRGNMAVSVIPLLVPIGTSTMGLLTAVALAPSHGAQVSIQAAVAESVHQIDLQLRFSTTPLVKS